MARNRKRAKERRVRQTQSVGTGRGREPRALDGGQEHPLDGGQERPLDGDRERDRRSEPLADLGMVPFPSTEPEDGAPDPIEHAAPDVELAELQLATASQVDEIPETSKDEDIAQTESDLVEIEERTSGRAPAPVTATQSAVTAPRPWLGARLLAFLEGSWRELQRVQWPDRRQVMQATGVVIGFVIVASVFLGLADLVASKVVSFILKGHF